MSPQAVLEKIQAMMVNGRFVVERPYSMNLKRAANHTGLGIEMLRDAIAAGHLPASKPGKEVLVKTDDLEGWIDRYDLGVPKLPASKPSKEVPK